MQKRKTAQPPRCLPFGRGISSPHGNGVTGKARHLAVSAIHEKGEPRKGRPIGHKKGILKDASVLGQIAFEVLGLSKGHPAEIAFLPNPRRVAAYRICVRRQGLSK